MLKEYQQTIFGVGPARVVYIHLVLQLVCCMFGANWPKCVVIIPHNALFIMHDMQATNYFHGTSLRLQ